MLRVKRPVNQESEALGVPTAILQEHRTTWSPSAKGYQAVWSSRNNIKIMHAITRGFVLHDIYKKAHLSVPKEITGATL